MTTKNLNIMESSYKNGEEKIAILDISLSFSQSHLLYLGQVNP